MLIYALWFCLLWGNDFYEDKEVQEAGLVCVYTPVTAWEI